MIDINELRRLAQAATPGPWKMLPVGDGRQKFAVADSEFLSILTVTDEGGATFGTVYDDADAKFIAAANPAAISDLLDRLEAAESDGLEQARLNGMGGEREAALLSKLEAAEKERDEFKRACFGHISDNSMLRAKIEAMEKQEPVGKFVQHPSNGLWEQDGYGDNPDANPLYALPGAQPAPSVPDVPAKSLKPVIDWLRNGCDPMKAADELEILIAAAPEAKPCP